MIIFESISICTDRLHWVQFPKSEISISPMLKKYSFRCQFSGGFLSKSNVAWYKNEIQFYPNNHSSSSKSHSYILKDQELILNVSKIEPNGMSIRCQVTNKDEYLSAATYVTFHGEFKSFLLILY